VREERKPSRNGFFPEVELERGRASENQWKRGGVSERQRGRKRRPRSYKGLLKKRKSWLQGGDSLRKKEVAALHA